MKNRPNGLFGLKPAYVAVLLVFTVQTIWANPLGSSVVSGQASFATAGNTLTITNTPGAIIAWQSFSIGANEATRFAQQSASSAVLNRVTGADPSSLLGSLQSNGRVFLVNPHGIVFGKGSAIDTAGFIASTLDISDRDFLEGRLRFEGGGLGVLRNEGAIRASGDIFLVGPQIENAGLIRSDTGSVLLAAGKSVTISSPDAQGVQFALQAPDDSALNLGAIEAKNAAAMFAGTLRHSGEIHANRITLSATGEAVLEAGSNVAASGEGASALVWSDDTASAHGTISAKGADGKGGFVETSAHTLDVNGIRVDTGGGQWLIDPNDFTIAASGGSMTGATLSANLGGGNVTILSSGGAAAGNGDINVNDAVSWSANLLTLTAARDININAVMTASDTSSLALNPATANGADAAVSGGIVKVGMNGSGFLGRVDFPGRSGAGFLTINGNGFTVINSLGAEGSVTTTDLQGMNGNLGGFYALGSDIDATATSGWNAGAGFTPIGSPAARFTGQFNGLGHTIGNLTINRGGEDHVGLFGNVYWYGAALSNVGLVGGSVTGKSNTGGLVGYIDQAAYLTNSFNTGSVTSPWSWCCNGIYVGGLVGQNYHTPIDNSFSTGNVSGNYYAVGGLVGANGSWRAVISDSYATGNVTCPGGAASECGGLVGMNSSGISKSYATGNVVVNGRGAGGLAGTNSGWVADSYATGNVSVTSAANGGYAGGLVGWVQNSGSVSNSYATGSVTSVGTAGGLVGANTGWGAVTNSFWDTQTSGQAASAGGTGLSTAQMKQQANFTGAGWDFTGTWRIYEGNTYPLLRSLLTPLVITANNAGKTYDGLVYGGGNGVSYSIASPTLSGALVYSGNSQGAINTGAYTITPGGYYSNDYNITYGNGALTVNPAPLTVTANNAGKTYDGIAYSGGNGVSYSGFVNGETGAVLGGALNYGGSSQGAVNAGNYAITPSGLTAANYTISFSDGTLTIAAAPSTSPGTPNAILYRDTYSMITADRAYILNDTLMALFHPAIAGGTPNDKELSGEQVCR